MFEIKKRLVFSLLVVVTAWPPVHFVLTQTHEIDPWGFFGLAMYTAPRRIFAVTDFRVGFGNRRLQRLNRRMLGQPPEVKAEKVDRLTREIGGARLYYGDLYVPPAPVEELFGMFPKVTRIMVELRSDELGPAAILMPRLMLVHCQRDAPDASVRCGPAPDS